MRKAIVVAVSAVTAVSAIAASVATADSSRVASPAAPNCKLATIATHGAVHGTGRHPPGLDQRNWGRVFITNWNAGRAIPGVPRALKRTKLKALEADTQLERAGRGDRRRPAALEQGRARRQRLLRQPGERRRWADPAARWSRVRLRLGDAGEPDRSDDSGRELSSKNGFFRRVVPTDNFQARNRRDVRAAASSASERATRS